MTQTTLEAIDGAIEAWETSPDAMRCSPDDLAVLRVELDPLEAQLLCAGDQVRVTWPDGTTEVVTVVDVQRVDLAGRSEESP